jgi:serine/threonine-protein kinase HipA
VVFNALLGNHDAHAKNFSLLYTAEAPTLAPAYDLLATAVYPRLAKKMAMKIGGKYRFSEVQARHWEQFAESAGLAKAPARRRILEMARALPAAARKLQADPSQRFAASPMVGRILTLVEQRCALTLRRLTESFP